MTYHSWTCFPANGGQHLHRFVFTKHTAALPKKVGPPGPVASEETSISHGRKENDDIAKTCCFFQVAVVFFSFNIFRDLMFFRKMIKEDVFFGTSYPKKQAGSGDVF